MMSWNFFAAFFNFFLIDSDVFGSKKRKMVRGLLGAKERKCRKVDIAEINRLRNEVGEFEP